MMPAAAADPAPRPRAAPLVIYVLWHPAAAAGAPLASEIYRWFHASSDDLLRSGLGVPVYFRSAPAPGAQVPRAIGIDEADLNVVVVLADEHMLADPAWTAYLVGIASAAKERLRLVPVALHASAYRLPEALRRLNFLRVDERGEQAADGAALLARRAPRLLRQLTEVIGRDLAVRLAEAGRNDLPAGAAPPPLTIFLSHAKRDGVHIASALRSSIQDHGRLRAFFDESDLPVGQAFATELERAARAGSAAMIAIVSDAYAARPWCRREVALARVPRAEPGSPACWAIQPLLVVDGLDAEPTRGIPEFGASTLVRWRPERALAMVDLLMLEALLNSHRRLQALRVPAAPGRHVISWAPDLPTLVAVRRAAAGAITEVAYPGFALPDSEREDLLRELRRDLPELVLRTFEEIEHPPAEVRALDGDVVGLSAGVGEDLGAHGLGREHLEEVTLAVARTIVEAGGRIAYGGILGSTGLTETLLTLVRTLTPDDDTVTATTPEARILSYQRWPSLPSREQIAGDVGICEYVLIDPPLPAAERLDHDPRMKSPERARQQALVLSEMREAMTRGGRPTTAGRPAPRLAARVVMSGLRCGFNGAMQGVVEEALYALEAGLPVYVIGGLGGGAGLLADALLGDRWPGELTPEHHLATSAAFRMLAAGHAARGEPERIAGLHARLRRQVDRVRADLAAGLANGLDDEDNRRLMRSDHVSTIARLLRKGFRQRLAARVG